MRRRRHELASAGFDDFGATLGGYGTRLRVPALTGTPPFLFLLAVCDLVPGDCIVGLEQYADLAAIFGTGSPPDAPAPGPAGPPNVFFYRPIEDAMWHPPDGIIVWTLTLDAKATTKQRRGPLDQDSFTFEDSSTPALLYESATIPFPNPIPGYLGLSAYTPPGKQGVAKLTMRDIRFPWGENHFDALREPITVPTRARFYAEVTQTTPSNAQTNPRPIFKINLATPGAPQVLLKEDLFLQFFENAQYFGVAGRIIVDRCKPRESGD